MLSDSPPEKDIAWSDQGMVACNQFIQKLWTSLDELSEFL